MDDLSDTSLGMSAEDFYDEQLSKRTGPVELGRRLADLSSPSAFPPEDWQTGDPLTIPNQSVNAYALNTLSSKIMLTGMPPGQAGWKFTPIENKLDEEAKQDPALWGRVVYAMSRREETHRQRLEATQARTAITLYYKLLLLTGNAAVLWAKIDTPVVYNMHHYVVKRDAAGTPLAGAIKVGVSRMSADPDVVDAADRNRAEKGLNSVKSPWEDEIIVYHVQKLITNEDGSKEYAYWQEVEGGELVEGSEAFTPVDRPTIWFGGMIPDYGSDWFIPYCADYEGDMSAVENYSAALQDGGAAAARFLTLVDPNGVTELKDILEADNLEVVPGREQDVKTLRSDKGGDLQVTASEMEKAARRLGQVFLMFSSVQRQGERVTAEEWRILAQEIDQAMGGLYSMISQTSQRYFVLRFILLHEEEDKSLGTLPDDLVRTTVVTGIDSMGQTAEGTKFKEFMATAKELLGDALMQFIEPSEALRRLAAYDSIKSDGLVKDTQQVQAETEQNQQLATQQTLLEKATGPLATGGADILGKMLEGTAQIPEGAIPA